MSAAFSIRKSTNGQFHFNLKAANNKIILSSETYRNKGGAQAGIQSVKTNCAGRTAATSAGNRPRVSPTSSSSPPTKKSSDGAKCTRPSRRWSAASLR